MVRLSFIKAAEQIFYHSIEKWPPRTIDSMRSCCVVIPNFVSADEESQLMAEIEPHMKRLKYEDAHWDDVGI